MKKAFLLVLIGLFLANAHEVKSEHYTLAASGTLSQQVTPSKLADITELKVSGKVGVADFDYIRKTAGKLLALDLQDATLDNGLLPDKACYGMTSLSTIVLPFFAEKIGDSVFIGTNIKGQLYLPAGLKHIGVAAFAGCAGLTGTLDIPSSVTILEDAIDHKGAFYGCSGLEALDIPVDSKLTHIGAGSFNGCSGLKSVLLPKSITSIGGGAFAGCTGWCAEKVDLSHVRSIGGYEQGLKGTFGAFEGCEALEGIRIDPNVLVRIGNRAFKGCSSLKGAVSIHFTVLNESSETFDGTQLDVQSIVSSYIRPDDGTQEGDGRSWETAYIDFGEAVGLREGRDDRFFFMEGHHMADRQYFESEYVALMGGYDGTERWGEEPRGGESRLSIAPSDNGDVLVFDYNWDIPLQIDIQNIAVDGLTIMKQAEGNWQGAKITNATFYSPVSIDGEVTFQGDLKLDGTFTPTGKVIMDNVTFSPSLWDEYDETTGIFTGLSLSELSIIDSFVINFPMFKVGERTILTTKEYSRPPLSYFRHTVNGHPLSSSEQVRFEWIPEGDINKLQMITSAPLSISVAGGGAPILSFGEQLQLQAKFSDESKQGETSWTSSRTDIVTVDAQTGDLTAANVPSDATVTVSSIVNKQSLSSTCRVYVAQVRFKAVNPHTVPLLSSARFRTDVLPATLPDAHLVWSVSDTTIATIDSLSGVLLTRGRVGHLTVTARLRANEKVFATHEVYIVPASIDLLPLFPDEPLERGHSYGFKLLLEPEAENESELSVTYSVSDPTVAVVSGDSIYAVGEGTAVIRVYVQQAPDAILSDSITVRVFNPAARVEVPESLPVGLGDIFDVPVALFPEDVSEVKLNWISKNPAVVAVRPDGRFTASALGTALLIVSTSTGLSDTCEVQVGASVIRMDAQSLTLQKETSFPLSVSFVPISAHDDVLWSTSDPSVVVVDKTGLVTAVGAGQAKVIASTGARADTCRVTVIESTAGLSFYFVENYKVMSPGEDFTIPLINATGQSATWHTDNPYVANVNNRGVVTTYSLGTAAISAISSDGVKAQCIVSVQATSIDVPMTKAASIDYRFGKLFVKGLAGHNILVTSLAGQVKAAFIPSGDDESRPLYLPVGIYVIRSFGGPRQAVYKVVVR